MKTPILVLVLFLLVLLPLTAEIGLVVFPKEPVDMSLSPNPEIPVTRMIVVPSINFSEIDGNTTLGEIWGNLSKSEYWASFGESLPLLALRLAVEDVAPSLPELEILRITAVVGGLVNFHYGSFVDYLVKGDVFLSSPAFDRKYNDYDGEVGNGLILSAGYLGKGTAFDEGRFWDSPLDVLDENYLTFHGFIVARAPWTMQFVVLDFGYSKPFTGNAEPYFDFSGSMNFPVGRSGKNLLYISGYLKALSFDYIPSIIGQAGLVIPGEVPNRSLITYGEIETRYDDPNYPTYHGRLGIKLNL